MATNGGSRALVELAARSVASTGVPEFVVNRSEHRERMEAWCGMDPIIDLEGRNISGYDGRNTVTGKKLFYESLALGSLAHEALKATPWTTQCRETWGGDGTFLDHQDLILGGLSRTMELVTPLSSSVRRAVQTLGLGSREWKHKINLETWKLGPPDAMPRIIERADPNKILEFVSGYGARFKTWKQYYRALLWRRRGSRHHLAATWVQRPHDIKHAV